MTTRLGLANEGLIKGQQLLNSRAAASRLDKCVRDIQTIRRVCHSCSTKYPEGSSNPSSFHPHLHWHWMKKAPWHTCCNAVNDPSDGNQGPTHIKSSLLGSSTGSDVGAFEAGLPICCNLGVLATAPASPSETTWDIFLIKIAALKTWFPISTASNLKSPTSWLGSCCQCQLPSPSPWTFSFKSVVNKQTASPLSQKLTGVFHCSATHQAQPECWS